MYISLHTAEPNAANFADTEVEYDGYDRACLDGIPFTFLGTRMANLADVSFPQCLSQPIRKTVTTHFAIVTDNSPRTFFVGAGKLDKALKIEKTTKPNFKANAIMIDVVPSSALANT